MTRRLPFKAAVHGYEECTFSGTQGLQISVYSGVQIENRNALHDVQHVQLELKGQDDEVLYRFDSFCITPDRRHVGELLAVKIQDRSPKHEGEWTLDNLTDEVKSQLKDFLEDLNQRDTWGKIKAIENLKSITKKIPVLTSSETSPAAPLPPET